MSLQSIRQGVLEDILIPVCSLDVFGRQEWSYVQNFWSLGPLEENIVLWVSRLSSNES